MSSAGLYTTPSVFARVIYASAELFLGGLQSLIRRINPIVQTGPPLISTTFARSNWCIYSSEPSVHPICDYGELSCLGPEPPRTSQTFGSHFSFVRSLFRHIPSYFGQLFLTITTLRHLCLICSPFLHLYASPSSYVLPFPFRRL